MSRPHLRRSHPIPRLRRHRRTARNAALVLATVGILFGMACLAHRVEELECRRTRLVEERAYQLDEYWRLSARWYRQTSRERILARASTELDLREPSARGKEIVALDRVPVGSDESGLLRELARGLDRYGAIRSAQAGERRP